MLSHSHDIVPGTYGQIIHSWQWRHNERDGVSNHQPHDCLLNRLFRRRSKKTSNLCVTGLCEGNSPGTGEFPAQRASHAENVSIWWRHYECFAANIPAIYYVASPIAFGWLPRASFTTEIMAWISNHMMTSSNGNIFRVTGPLCGEFTGHRWIPHTKASDAELWCFLWSAHKTTLRQIMMETPMIWDAVVLIMTSL